MGFGIDYAWGRPSVAALHGSGVTFVCRYLSRGGSKDLTHSEAKELSDAGISIVVVYETSATEAENGYAAGHSDALAALAEAQACGMPPSRPIYFAVDENTTVGPHIKAYFQGACAAIGRFRVGVYAGFAVVKALLDDALVGWAWQTYAWSGGDWDARRDLEQYSNGHTLDGVGVDYDQSEKNDFGQWRIGWSPSPVSNPTPTPVPPLQEDDMIGISVPDADPFPISWDMGEVGSLIVTSAAPVELTFTLDWENPKRAAGDLDLGKTYKVAVKPGKPGGVLIGDPAHVYGVSVTGGRCSVLPALAPLNERGVKNITEATEA